MEAYPPDYIDHNLPLILLSGLGSDPQPDAQDKVIPDGGTEYPPLRDGGVEIFSDFPLLTDSTAERVLNALLSEDATGRPWNSKSDGARAGAVGYKVKRVGRVGQRSLGRFLCCLSCSVQLLLILVDLIP